MKKSIFFIALFALCCVFIPKDVVLADTYEQSFNYSLISGVFWQTDFPGTSTCDMGFNKGVYPTVDLQNGGWSMPCDYYGHTGIDMETWGGSYGDGQFWIQLRLVGTSVWKYYTPFYRTSAAWSDTPPVVSPTITITSPASGATITDTTTTLDGTWAGIDPDIYHNISISLNSNFIGEQSVVKLIPITNATGSFSFALSFFDISANGQWNLKGSATYANTQLSDMYITTDIISPAGYNLIFDVSGFHTPFTFTDFDTWYDANVVNYNAPSAWASGMIGYLQPILEKIAEFGARMQDYLDTSTAWQRGNDIGSVFPVVNAYILKINIFFGGFPIAQFFQWGILIMIGMFAIKIILKLLSFIPIIGGGG